MRILQVNKYLYRRGGAEAYMLDLSDLLRADGHEVELFGMHHPQNPRLRFARHFPSLVELEPPPSGVVRKAEAMGRMLWSSTAARGLRSTLAELRPDVVHLHNVYHQLSPSVVRAAHASGAAVVMTLHDYKLVCPTYQLLDNGRICEACVGGHFYQAPLRACRNGSRLQSGIMAAELALHTRLGSYGGVHRFLCPSRFLADKIAEGGVYPDRLHVLANFSDPSGVAVKEIGGGPFLYGGRLSHEKGIDVLIRAVELVPDARLAVAGEGPARADLEALATELAPGRVDFLGRLAKAELLDAMRAAAAVVLPARWYENQPIIVLEAFACGVPVVASDLGGLPELVRPGETGWLVPPDDPAALAAALRDVTSDPARALRLGRAGRAVLEAEHGPKRHLDQLLGHYRAAV